jgi:hypothetical protein
MSLKTYSLVNYDIVASGNNVTRDFLIRANNRELKIKSILWDISIRDDSTGQIIPFGNCTRSRALLRIGDTDTKLCQAFEPVGLWSPYYNGLAFDILTPQQLFFDSFFITNDLPIEIFIDNNLIAGAPQVTYYYTLVIETEENILY